MQRPQAPQQQEVGEQADIRGHGGRLQLHAFCDLRRVQRSAMPVRQHDQELLHRVDGQALAELRDVPLQACLLQEFALPYAGFVVRREVRRRVAAAQPQLRAGGVVIFDFEDVQRTHVHVCDAPGQAFALPPQVEGRRAPG